MMKKIFLAGIMMTSLSVPAFAEGTSGNMWGQVGNASNSSSDSYCSSNVSNQMGQASAGEIQREKILAQNLIPFNNNSYTTGTCLDQLLHSGLNIFTGMSLSSILDNLISNACSMIMSEANEELSNLSGDVMGNLPTGEILPGVGLGDMNFGVGFSPSIGGGSNNIQTGGGYLSGISYPGVNLTQYMPNEGKPYTVDWPSSWSQYNGYQNGGGTESEGMENTSWGLW